ncbi:unnamed protein product [Fusarium fujikuroi]|uniref:Uncharacterized protein n=1 Tax=Fusarium fujikuroi TaxID=5127 RepID=A0A9Q9RQW5_FUSFU|nr:unnamed protein product [Fusarium fujikuroi]VTT82162.1 unnamed protein product [Fusarium fujikuroi]
MATDSTKNADVPKEQSIPDKKNAPETAEHSSAELNKNTTDMTTSVNKDDKTVGVKKSRRKVLDEHYSKLANTTPEEFLTKNPHPKDVSTSMMLSSEAHQQMTKVEDDDMAYLEHYYDNGKLSEYDLLELGAREMYL